MRLLYNPARCYDETGSSFVLVRGWVEIRLAAGGREARQMAGDTGPRWFRSVRPFTIGHHSGSFGI